MRKMMNGWMCAFAGVLLVAVGAVQAATIDFETGFAELDEVESVSVDDVEVAFDTDTGDPLVIAEVGNQGGNVAFGPDDTPVNAISPGAFFLTNGSGTVANYLLGFSVGIMSLSVDVYDIAGDGSSQAGDTTTLTLFADAERTQALGSDTFTTVGTEGDGYAVRLIVDGLSLSNPAVAASIIIDSDSPDTGNGIDNVTFQAIPEPASLMLLGVGGMVLLRRGRIRLRS